MFSKIILAALCSAAVSGSAGTPGQNATVPIVNPIPVIPGCANLWASPQSFITAAIIDEKNGAKEDKPEKITFADGRELYYTFCTKDIKNPIKTDESGSAFVV